MGHVFVCVENSSPSSSSFSYIKLKSKRFYFLFVVHLLLWRFCPAMLARMSQEIVFVKKIVLFKIEALVLCVGKIK